MALPSIPLAALGALALLGAEPAPPADAAPAAAPAPQAAPEAAAAPRRPYVVEQVIVTGLARTRLSAVRQHLLVREGDVLDDDAVLRSRLRLLQLGWFSRVEARIERGSAPGLVRLVLAAEERNTLLVTDLALGTTGAQPIYGGVGLSEQNFLGEGLVLGGAFVAGGSPLGRPADPDRFALRAHFFAPDVRWRDVARFVLSATGWAVRGEEFACPDADCDAFRHDLAGAPRLRYRRAGAEVLAGVRTGPFSRVLGGLRVDALRADPRPSSGPFAPPPIRDGRSATSALVVAWERDTRNDLFLPREGTRWAAQLAFSSRLLGSDYEFSRYALQAETAFALLGLPLRLQLFAGAVQGDAPFFERFYAADLSYFAIGPALGRALELNFSTDARYDAFAAMGGLEWAFALPWHNAVVRRAYVAAGARFTWSSATLGGGRRPASSVPFSADVALRFDTPVGAFNASLGYWFDNLR
jgi:outer membrane protein insertion porin family